MTSIYKIDLGRAIRNDFDKFKVFQKTINNIDIFLEVYATEYKLTVTNFNGESKKKQEEYKENLKNKSFFKIKNLFKNNTFQNKTIKFPRSGKQSISILDRVKILMDDVLKLLNDNTVTNIHIEEINRSCKLKNLLKFDLSSVQQIKGIILTEDFFLRDFKDLKRTTDNVKKNRYISHVVKFLFNLPEENTKIKFGIKQMSGFMFVLKLSKKIQDTEIPTLENKISKTFSVLLKNIQNFNSEITELEMNNRITKILINPINKINALDFYYDIFAFKIEVQFNSNLETFNKIYLNIYDDYYFNDTHVTYKTKDRLSENLTLNSKNTSMSDSKSNTVSNTSSTPINNTNGSSIFSAVASNVILKNNLKSNTVSNTSSTPIDNTNGSSIFSAVASNVILKNNLKSNTISNTSSTSINNTNGSSISS